MAVEVYEALLLAYPACLLLPAWHGLITRTLFDVGETIWIIPVAVSMPILLFIWYRRGYREATWLILPSLLPMVSIAINDIGIVASTFGWGQLAFIGGGGIRVGGFYIYAFGVANLLFLLAICIVMFFRFTRVSQEQARAASELDAAREIQQYLIPSHLPRPRAWKSKAPINPPVRWAATFSRSCLIPRRQPRSSWSAMSPAKACRPACSPHSSLAPFAWRLKFTCDPAEILALLNERLQGRGLVTCQALLIAPGGNATLANAGHLPPLSERPGSCS